MSKHQDTISLSSLKAEYMALTQAMKEAIWLKNYLINIGAHIDSPLILHGDNQGSLTLAKNPVYHALTKHIDIQHHFVCEKVANGTIALKYIPTKEMVANAMTKSLPRNDHNKFALLMGLSDP
jgi:hypothetical protein